jgi:hypothetical protein
VGEGPPNPLEAALAHLRGVYRASPGIKESGWFTRLEFEEHQLLNWARDAGFLGSELELIPLSNLAGEEHRVHLDKASRLVFKATHPETYGAAPQISYDLDPVTNRPAKRLVMGKGTPMLYLERWSLFNAVFGDEVRLERILSIGYGLSIIVSQRDITGDAPSVEEIAEFFHERDFVSVPSSQDAFYRAADDVLALDAHQANLVRTEDGLVPIDIPIFHPDEDISRWLRDTGL